MAEFLSAQITNAQATPLVRNNSVEGAGVMREVYGNVVTVATEPTTSVLRFVRVPSNARISQVMVNAADATTGGAIDLGIYTTNDGDGLVVDADLFCSALALTGGPFNNSDQTYESGEFTYAESEMPLWEVLGLTSDPNLEYDVTAKVTTTFNGGPLIIGVRVRYVI